MYPDASLQLSYQTDTTAYFFSHGFDPLNNWSANTVTIWGRTFPTLEHAYHFRKFSDADPVVAKKIATAPSPWVAMQLAKKHKSKRRADWDEVKVGIMTELARAKVAQNTDVRDCLLATGDRQIIENSPWDTEWGCGEDGKGQNRMGKILMQVREELQGAVKPKGVQ